MTRQPQRAEIRTRTLVLATVEVTALLVTIGIGLQVVNLPFGFWFTEVMVFLAVPWLALRRRGYDPIGEMGLRTGGVRAFGQGALVGIVNYALVAIPIGVAVEAVFQRIAPDLASLFSIAKLFEGRGMVELIAIFAAAVVGAPLCEEAFFRGLLLRGVRARAPHGEIGRRSLGVLAGVSLLFAALHFDPVGLTVRFELGFALGLVFLRTRSLWASIGLHFATNALACTAMVAGLARSDGQPTAVTTALGCGALGCASAAVIIWAGRRWLPRGAIERESAPLAPSPFSWLRAAAAWSGVTVLASGAFVLIDYRGIKLDIVDLGFPLANAATSAQRAELNELRRRAKQGDASVEDYAVRRRALTVGATKERTP